MMLLDYFRGFWFNFWKKGRNQQIWANFGALHCGEEIPHSNVGPRGVACPRQGVACPRRGMAEREVWTASGTPRHRKAMPRRRSMPQRCTYTAWKFLCFVLFCYPVIPRTCLLE